MAASMEEADLLMMDSAVVVPTVNAQKMRHFLEEDGYWDSRRRLQKLDGDVVAIPVEASISSAIDGVSKREDAEVFRYDGKISKTGCYRDLQCHLVSVSLPPAKRQLAVSPHRTLADALRERFEEMAVPFPGESVEEIPSAWEKHGDLVLFPEPSFRSSVWERCPDLWPTVARALGGQRVARKARVKRDAFRSPRVELLLGNDGWVEHRDNGIRYSYDIRCCMFSAGNITEKMRVARLDCSGETVVDLYAGIGYFTLPYLVHAKASVVHACEWNPDAVAALRKNLVLNGVRDRCVVHEGDNRKVCPTGIADSVNLGLIPNSQGGWPVACAALKPQSGGVLHIHGNVTSRTGQTTPARAGCRGVFARDGGMSTSSSGERTASGVSPSPTGIRTADPRRRCENVNRDLEPHRGIVGEGMRQCTSQLDLDSSHLGNGQSREEAKVAMVTEDYTSRHGDERDCSKNETRRPQQSERSRFSTASFVDADLTPKDHWRNWAQSTARQIQQLLADIQGGTWTADVVHVEHVKSYAPHVDHIVADVRCVPQNRSTAAI